ncbi:MAG: prepilin-type N-terminal cleavage/methylation domain-containing protein [Phycisphaerales bacterium]|nr:prepilin-type N-terminal cleavage/methylation domain-containing protein [Phycisphaerales bacterium]MCI0629834.1 prepilin-type N-terminal cleavage/methylation domain-containing protein [Phycisphaerales bacterium]
MPRRAGFSLTELLVVIGIIVLLMGLLLVALGHVRKRAQRTQTEAVMNQFVNACAAFQTEHGFYPGVIPDHVIADNPGASGLPQISTTENALLHLIGGYRVLSPADDAAIPTAAENDYDQFRDAAQTAGSWVELVFGAGPTQWKLGVNLNKLGEGPVINGKPYAPYFTPGPKDVIISKYPHSSIDPTNQLPDLVDGWGQPIIYCRQSRERGPLLEDTTVDGLLPQFVPKGAALYLNALSLGEVGHNQVYALDNPQGGILTVGSPDIQNATFAMILAHPAFYKSTTPLYGTAQGAFVLISPGPDGIYFSAIDGPGSTGTPIDGITIGPQVHDVGPRVLKEFDDIVVFGGG